MPTYTIGMLEYYWFHRGTTPIQISRMPIIASRLTKGECSMSAKKITAKIQVWASRHISYTGRLVLVNTVLFGMFNFWAQVFILLQDVVNQVMKLCRNFLWGGNENYQKTLYVAWEKLCTHRKQGGLGIKNLQD